MWMPRPIELYRSNEEWCTKELWLQTPSLNSLLCQNVSLSDLNQLFKIYVKTHRSPILVRSWFKKIKNKIIHTLPHTMSTRSYSTHLPLLMFNTYSELNWEAGGQMVMAGYSCMEPDGCDDPSVVKSNLWPLEREMWTSLTRSVDLIWALREVGPSYKMFTGCPRAPGFQ